MMFFGKKKIPFFVSSVTCNSHDLEDSAFNYVKLFFLLYADGTVSFAETKDGLQHGLNIYKNYCDNWKLTLNTTKTKLLVFTSGRRMPYNFT
jgi:hypothetical protein